MRNSLLSLLLLSGAICLYAIPANAQYHYNYGSSRVVNQNQTGLTNPSSTYIGPGTLSQTARGENPNAQPSNLPAVNMGANIRTPGDNVYTPGTIKYQGRGGTRLRNAVNSQNRNGQIHYYVPGQNAGGNAVQSYGQQSPAPSTYNAVPSTYGNSPNKGTRGF